MPKNSKQTKAPAGLTSAIGVPGLSVWAGGIYEEWQSALKGTKARKIYTEMAEHATIATALDAVEMPLLAAPISVVPASEKKPDVECAEFVESCLDDMPSYPWRKHVRDCLSAIKYGWNVSEIIFKKRMGLQSDPSSQYDDGKLGIHMIDPRAQDTLDKWVYDDKGNLTDFQQRDPATGQIFTIPMWKCVHVAFRASKRNPEGMSMLRSIYRPWYFQKNLETLEGIGIERDLAGLPVIKLPYGSTNADFETAKKMVENLRNDEESGVVLPPPRNPEDKFGWLLELLSGGAKAYNTREVIRDLDKRILLRFFAQFLLLGMDKAGTQALVKGSHDFFSLSLKGIQQELLEVWNGGLVPLLVSVNNFPGITGMPMLDWAAPGKSDVAAMITTLSEAAKSNLVTPDDSLEEFIRAEMELPERDEPEELPGVPAPEQPEQPKDIEPSEPLKPGEEPGGEGTPKNVEPEG